MRVVPCPPPRSQVGWKETERVKLVPSAESITPPTGLPLEPAPQKSDEQAAPGEITLVSGRGPAFEKLKQIELIGSGAFGEVHLVRSRLDRRRFALKKIDKDSAAAARERASLDAFSHPFVLKMMAAYTDVSHLYLLTEFVPGGELLQLLPKLGQEAATTKFYVGEISLGLEHIHGLGFVHRDLKAENVLLDAHGHVRLADFGFAKPIGPRGRAYTQCGTPDYVPPELLAGKGVSFAGDLWALGVLTYEMVTGGFQPFTCPDNVAEQTFANILRGEWRWPRGVNVPRSARIIVEGLLRTEEGERLDQDGLVASRWYAHFDWDALANCVIEPPWRPRLRSADDLRYFCGEGEDGA